LNKRFLAIGNSIAAGFMISASFTMIYDGMTYSGWSVIVGMLLGCAFIVISHRRLHKYEHLKFEGMQGAGAIKILMLV
jgi:O-antigen/teichoic acid export membrane protein